MTNPHPSKTTLRQTCLAHRMQIPPDIRAVSARKAFTLFFQHVELPVGGIVAGYWPIRGELDDLPILRELMQRRHACALPQANGQGMPLVFRAWDDSSAMAVSDFGISEPTDEAPAITPDILLVPLAAFDTKKHRLGYGAGFYDRTITQLRSTKPVLAIGLAYESQLCDTLPAEEHDVPLDMIVTDRNIYR